jgi:hypothetical protein
MRTGATRVLKGQSGWRALTWILVLAFGLQSYITQTHIHGSAASFEVPAIGKVFGKTPAPAAPGERDDGSACPLCQAIVHAGAFFAPAAIALFLPVSWIEPYIHVLAPALSGSANAYHWQSRAPPRG